MNGVYCANRSICRAEGNLAHIFRADLEVLINLVRKIVLVYCELYLLLAAGRNHTGQALDGAKGVLALVPHREVSVQHNCKMIPGYGSLQ